MELPSLIFSGLIAGFLIPSLLKTYEVIFSKRVDRATELRNNQLKILEDFTKTVWEWRFTYKQVAYDGCSYKSDFSKFEEAVSNYELNVWKHFIEIKILKAKAIIWFKPEVSNDIENLYNYIKTEIDQELTSLILQSKKSSLDLTNSFYNLSEKFSNEVSERLDLIVQKIATNVSIVTIK